MGKIKKNRKIKKWKDYKEHEKKHLREMNTFIIIIQNFIYLVVVICQTLNCTL